jgi:uncharacterized protein YkwD
MKRTLVLCALLVTLGASLVGPANAAPASAKRLPTLDQQILAGLNETRAKHGLRPLVMSRKLQDAAVSHSKAMLEGGFFAHDAPGGATFVSRLRSFYGSSGYDSWSVGENLLYNTQEVTANVAIAAWLASPGHRENILTPKWREVGIGSLRASSAGGLFGGQATWVVTTDFGARSGKSAKSAANAVKRKTAVSRHKVKPVKSTTKATRGAKAKKTPARPSTVDRFLPLPSHGSEYASDDSADTADDDRAADAGADEGVAQDDESDDDGSDGDGIDELAVRSGW